MFYYVCKIRGLTISTLSTSRKLLDTNVIFRFGHRNSLKNRDFLLWLSTGLGWMKIRVIEIRVVFLLQFLPKNVFCNDILNAFVSKYISRKNISFSMYYYVTRVCVKQNVFNINFSSRASTRTNRWNSRVQPFLRILSLVYLRFLSEAITMYIHSLISASIFFAFINSWKR